MARWLSLIRTRAWTASTRLSFNTALEHQTDRSKYDNLLRYFGPNECIACAAAIDGSNPQHFSVDRGLSYQNALDLLLFGYSHLIEQYVVLETFWVWFFMEEKKWNESR